PLGSRCAICIDLKFAFCNFSGERLNIRFRAWARSGQSNVCSVDSKFIHIMKELNFLIDRRIFYGRRLKPVPQSFIIEQQILWWRLFLKLIPVVDEFRFLFEI